MNRPALELYIDELVIDGTLFGPGGHGPDFGLALASELEALLSAPQNLAALASLAGTSGGGGARMIRSLDAGALRMAGAGLCAGSLAPQLAQSVFGALRGGLGPAAGPAGLATGPKENP
jgi:hypothetical protein